MGSHVEWSCVCAYHGRRDAAGHQARSYGCFCHQAAAKKTRMGRHSCYDNHSCHHVCLRCLNTRCASARNLYVAEREGFEPSVRQAVQQISSLPRSTTPASLRGPNELQILSGASDPLLSIHILAQSRWHGDRPVRVLVILEDRDEP